MPRPGDDTCGRPSSRRPERIPPLAPRLVAAGASGLRYYHAGLASPARSAAIRDAVSAVRVSRSERF